MMKVTIELLPGRKSLRVEGRLSGPWVQELEHAWRTVAAESREEPVAVNLCGVTFIDPAGKKLLSEMVREGAELRAEGCMTKALVEEITKPRENAQRTNHKPTKRKKNGVLLFLPLLFFFAAPRARSQEKPPLRITLRDAVALALKQNPQVQIAALNLAQSEQNRSIARADLLPQAYLDVHDQAVRFNLEAGFGLRFPNSPQHVGPFQVFQAGPNFSQQIFDLTLWRRWQAARERVTSTSAQRQSVREQIVLLVVSQYLGVLRAGAEVQAALSRVELAQALFTQAQDLQKSGAGTGVDALRADVELQNEKQRLITAQTKRQTELNGLARLLNVDPRQPVELGDELSFFETPEFQAEQNLESAYAHRPELKALEAQRHALVAEKRAASESRLPAVHFTGNYAQQGISMSTVIPAYVYQASVDMPLFTGGRIHAEISRADLELQKTDQQIQDQKNEIALDVKNAIAELAAARNAVDVANRGVQLAQEVVHQSRDRFQAGVANNIEVVTAQDELARANDNQISALYNYNQARADLARALGQMESLYSR
jgi:outer membrane protein